jgi:outer membrane lipoprotein carrier protein
MIRISNRSLAFLAALALTACSSQTADSHRDAEPSLEQRVAPRQVASAAAVSTVADASAASRGSMVSGPHGGGPGTETVARSQDARMEASTSSRSTDQAPASAATPSASAEAPAQDRATQILRRVEQTAAGIRTLQADFTQRLDVALLNQHQQSSGRMYQKRPDRFLMRFTQPAGDVMVADGRHFWIYYPSTDRKQVIRTSIASGAGQVDLQHQFLGNATARFVATLAGDEAVAGRPAWVMTLVPRSPSGYKLLKVWVDKADYLVRRFEMTEENGSVRRVELRNLQVNGPVSDALFHFTPPAGTQVFDQ